MASESYQSPAPAVLEHFLNPRNAGDLPDADGIAEVGKAEFGDVVRLSLKVRNSRIAEARFRTYGCGTAIATTSVATELIRGRTVEEALQLSGQEIVAALGGLPPEKAHCPLLAVEAVKAAVKDFMNKRSQARAPGGRDAGNGNRKT